MTMTTYSGYEYLLIDIASQFGLDKLTFEKRIEWTVTNLDNLESFADTADTKPMFLKAVMALRKAQKGLPTGHLIGVDATASGIQIMSSLTGCEAGAMSTGLIDPTVRADIYTSCTHHMNNTLGGGFGIPRKDAKDCLMTSFYGSTAVPKRILGEDTPELDAFFEAAMALAPGAWTLLQELLASWQSSALAHEWQLPDGFNAKVKVMKEVTASVEVDELESSFTYIFKDNIGTKTGLSNAANVIHSVDAYVLRSMHRRCNYNAELVQQCAVVIQIELMKRLVGGSSTVLDTSKHVLAYFIAQYARSTVSDVVILPYLDSEAASMLSTKHLKSLSRTVNDMLKSKPFELLTVHDEFRAHANNLNQVRFHYKEILAEIAESDLLADLLNQICKTQGTYTKLSNTLGNKIRQSSYALA